MDKINFCCSVLDQFQNHYQVYYKFDCLELLPFDNHFLSYFVFIWFLFGVKSVYKMKFSLKNTFYNEISKQVFVINLDVKRLYNGTFGVLVLIIGMNNLLSLIPYVFSSFSQICITYLFSFSFFFSSLFISLKRYKKKFFKTFTNGIHDLAILLLLVPVEIISYFSKHISLALRLFINLMGGHSLLKVVAGFGFMILIGKAALVEGICGIPTFIILISLLISLEIGISFIQAYIYFILLLSFFTPN